MRTNLLLICISLPLFIACKKSSEPITRPDPVHPIMIYRNLQNAAVHFFHPASVDIDGDNTPDFSFSVLPVGDPLLQRDRLQFYAGSNVARNLLNNENDESPMLSKLDIISSHHAGYTWYQISAIVLAEKITDKNGSYWTGIWKNASRQYLPVQVEKNGKIYHGWIELSFDTAAEKLILHKSGVSTVENKEVKAGY